MLDVISLCVIASSPRTQPRSHHQKVAQRRRELKPARTSYDAIVIGGGPAGSTAATMMHQKGLNVLLAERALYPRFHIGESLLPASWAIWHKLGVSDTLRKSGQVVKLGSRFNLFGRNEYRYGLAFDAPEFFPDNQDEYGAFQVVRAEYDKMLIEHAKNVGVEVHQPASVQ